MLSNNLQKLKSSLNDVIENWINDYVESDGYNELDSYFSDKSTELMTEAAFLVLLAQSDLTKYYKDNGMLTEQE